MRAAPPQMNRDAVIFGDHLDAAPTPVRETGEQLGEVIQERGRSPGAVGATHISGDELTDQCQIMAVARIEEFSVPFVQLPRFHSASIAR